MFRILIVEDNVLFRQLLKETLQVHFPSAEISEAANGSIARRRIEATPPDVIFMDIKLPGENGLELVKKVKARYPAITVIVLTSHDLPEYRQAARNLDVDHFLSKGSTTMEDVVRLIESLLSCYRDDGFA